MYCVQWAKRLPTLVPADSIYARRLWAIEELALCGTMPRRQKSILSSSNVKRLEEIMKRSHHFHRRALIRYCFALAAASLVVGAAPKLDPAAKALATSALAQAAIQKLAGD